MDVGLGLSLAMWAKCFSVEDVLAEAASHTCQAGDILGQLLDCLHLLLDKLRLQPVGQLCKYHTESIITAIIWSIIH